MQIDLTDFEVECLLNALEEFDDVLGAKELENNEIGLNSDRLIILSRKLIYALNKSRKEK